MMNSVYDYIMNKNPEKDFSDEMWIHNCYNEDLNMRSQEPQDINAHFPEANLTDEDRMEFKRYMNARVYLNLLESDSIVNEDKEYSFAMMPPCEYDRFSPYANEELAEASINENHIICNKFTECFTLGMVIRLSNQLHIDEELLKIESTTDDYQEVWLAECLVCGGRGFFGNLCMKCKYGTYNLSI